MKAFSHVELHSARGVVIGELLEPTLRNLRPGDSLYTPVDDGKRVHRFVVMSAVTRFVRAKRFKHSATVELIVAKIDGAV